VTTCTMRQTNDHRHAPSRSSWRNALHSATFPLGNAINEGHGALDEWVTNLAGRQLSRPMRIDLGSSVFRPGGKVWVDLPSSHNPDVTYPATLYMVGGLLDSNSGDPRDITLRSLPYLRFGLARACGLSELWDGTSWVLNLIVDTSDESNHPGISRAVIGRAGQPEVVYTNGCWHHVRVCGCNPAWFYPRARASALTH